MIASTPLRLSAATEPNSDRIGVMPKDLILVSDAADRDMAVMACLPFSADTAAPPTNPDAPVMYIFNVSAFL